MTMTEEEEEEITVIIPSSKKQAWDIAKKGLNLKGFKEIEKKYTSEEDFTALDSVSKAWEDTEEDFKRISKALRKNSKKCLDFDAFQALIKTRSAHSQDIIAKVQKQKQAGFYLLLNRKLSDLQYFRFLISNDHLDLLYKVAGSQMEKFHKLSHVHDNTHKIIITHAREIRELQDQVGAFSIKTKEKEKRFARRQIITAFEAKFFHLWTNYSDWRFDRNFYNLLSRFDSNALSKDEETELKRVCSTVFPDKGFKEAVEFLQQVTDLPDRAAGNNDSHLLDKTPHEIEALADISENDIFNELVRLCYRLNSKRKGDIYSSLRF